MFGWDWLGWNPFSLDSASRGCREARCESLALWKHCKVGWGSPAELRWPTFWDYPIKKAERSHYYQNVWDTNQSWSKARERIQTERQAKGPLIGKETRAGVIWSNKTALKTHGQSRRKAHWLLEVWLRQGSWTEVTHVLWLANQISTNRPYYHNIIGHKPITKQDTGVYSKRKEGKGINLIGKESRAGLIDNNKTALKTHSVEDTGIYFFRDSFN